MKKGFFIFVLCFHFLGFSQEFKPEFKIVQEENNFDLKRKNTTLKLDKAPFSLVFKSKPYNNGDDTVFHATQIAVSKSKNTFGKIKNGMQISDIACFSPGTGIATRGPYEWFFLSEDYPDNEGHHYIMYDFNDEKRATLLSEENNSLTLQCDVNGIYTKDQVVQIEDMQTPLYFLIFNDFNKNKLVDKGEYRLVKVEFN